MSAPDEAAAILSHYFRSLARAAGVKWTTANDADLQRVADLLSDSGLSEIPTFYQPDEPAPEAPQPAHHPATPGPRRSGGITPTTTTEDDRAYLRRLAASNGVEATRKRGA